MASFVIHHVLGMEFLKILENNFQQTLTEDEKKDFLLGNLIVDSTRIKEKNQSNYSQAIQKEKIKTHFRSETDRELCVQAPILSAFIEKYASLFDGNFSVLGYFFHLYTDKMFFEDLFQRTFTTLDKMSEKTLRLNEVDHILVHKNGKIYDPLVFWSSDGLYQDYTTMNHMILTYYNEKFDKEALFAHLPFFINPGIEEVDFENGEEVLNRTIHFISESEKQTTKYLNIFDEQQVLKFMASTGTQFIETYGIWIEKTLSRKNLKPKVIQRVL